MGSVESTLCADGDAIDAASSSSAARRQRHTAATAMPPRLPVSKNFEVCFAVRAYRRRATLTFYGTGVTGLTVMGNHQNLSLHPRPLALPA